MNLLNVLLNFDLKYELLISQSLMSSTISNITLPRLMITGNIVMVPAACFSNFLVITILKAPEGAFTWQHFHFAAVPVVAVGFLVVLLFGGKVFRDTCTGTAVWLRSKNGRRHLPWCVFGECVTGARCALRGVRFPVGSV